MPKLNRIILHLDDSRIALKLLANAFRDIVNIVSVSDIQSARDAIAEEADICCFILDNHLVDGTGLDLIKDIRRKAQYKTTPIILFTSTLTNSVAHKAMTYGVNQSLPKVISNKDLVREVLSQVENPRIKVVAKEYHEVYCATWEHEGRFFQYSPDTHTTVEGATKAEAQESMESALQEKLNSAAYENHMVHEVELQKHIIYTPHGLETKSFAAVDTKHPPRL